MFFNLQIMHYSGTDSLAVYGILVNISTIVQCCAYSVGQASQPIISLNFGAGQKDRIRQVLRCALWSIAFFSIVWTLFILLFPQFFVYIFMTPTQTVLSIAPFILRCYGLSYICLPLNVFSTYYFQVLMKPGISFAISIGRGFILSGILIYFLPMLGGADLLWFAMPITELIISIVAIYFIARFTKDLSNTN